ncbi:MAG TPA: glycolate oxidase subunit GlcE [Noviherbaspirillum sp.]|jgi:glycolate oxidase FAD binding subunit|uniref:glycolate oxidase subunit GlcE n=1 Tax=Noviherbaspirillum sp. TaxID=1926288 RepID=UPI002DDCA4C5|nr:glycolate oxidase subunit GlcE [Noviherbaspirillum sp.]HEV2609294.1 glycolate oxidase subunit GlcE [Noviherbaspirillum sp.]
MEQALQHFRASIASATGSKRALRIRGGGSKDWYGQALQGEPLDTRAHTGIVAYDPTELVITARCGTPLAEIEEVLAGQNQMLAFEPPHFGAGATIGGVVASGLSGPRRQAVGSVRDFVLGAVLMDGNGEVLHFGGQVMKNVAGYDVSRLLAGSLGTLGLILEVSLKVLPRPLLETTLRFEADEDDAIRRLNEWGGQPLPISACAWHGNVLIVRLSGAEPAINAARLRMGGEEVAQAEPFWAELREQANPFFTDLAPSESLWRLSVPSHVPPLSLPGEQLIEWGGAQRWLKTDASATAIRAGAQQAGGHATLFKGGDKSAGVFHPLAPAVARIHRNLKNAFDPAGIFNPGRMYSDL